MASLFSVFIFSFSDCGNKCFGEYCSDIIKYQLIDQNTQNDLLFGANPIYKLDSLQLNRTVDFQVGKHANFISTVSRNGDVLQMSSYSPLETMYLRLSSNDIDTLIVQYQFVDNDCCERFGGYGSIVRIQYNGEMAEKAGDVYRFIKK